MCRPARAGDEEGTQNRAQRIACAAPTPAIVQLQPAPLFVPCRPGLNRLPGYKPEPLFKYQPGMLTRAFGTLLGSVFSFMG